MPIIPPYSVSRWIILLIATPFAWLLIFFIVALDYYKRAKCWLWHRILKVFHVV